MAGVQIILCVFLCFHLVVGQFGFFPQRSERRIPSPFDLAQNIFLNPNGFRNPLNNIFNIRRPSQNNQYEQNRPIVNNGYDPNRPIYNNEYEQNRPINNNQYNPNQYDPNNYYNQNRPINNNPFGQNNNQYDPNQYNQNRPTDSNQFDQNGQNNQNNPNWPINNNQYDQNGQIYNQNDQNYNRPNDVSFPNQGGQNSNMLTDNVNVGQPIPTNNPFLQPDQSNSLNGQTGYGFQNSGANSNQETLMTNSPNINDGENSYSIENTPTFATLDKGEGSDDNGKVNEEFGNNSGIPNVPPPQLPTDTSDVNEQNSANFDSPPTFAPISTGNDGQFGNSNGIPNVPPPQLPTDTPYVNGQNSANFDNLPTFAPISTGNDGQFGNSNGIPNVPPPQLPTDTPNVNGQNSANFDSPPTFAPISTGNDDQFDNKNGIPNVPPTQFSTTDLPKLTPVPDSEKRNNFNFGTLGIFQEPCTTVEGTSGSCISIGACEPIAKLLKTVKSNPAAIQVLRKAHCGFEGNNPKVCCPLPSIPNVRPPSPTPPATTSAPTAAPVTDPPASGKSLTSDFLPAFPAPPECGLTNATFSRVVGGIDANLGDFPWMALLGYLEKRGSSTRWLCGGSLVSSHHVLTAAHCIHNHEEDLYLVRLGELDLAREDEGATPIDIRIKSKIKHEGYNPKAFTNDIALLILEKDVQFTELIRPICIPTNAELRANNFVNYNPMIAGWGDTEFRGPSATHLQVLQLPVVSNEFCAEAYVQYKAQVIDERVLCAGFKKGGKDACQGDSGGPLMQPVYYPQNLTTYFYQIGVVSYGKRCAEAGFPGVYSRVTHFVPWLQQNMLGA